MRFAPPFVADLVPQVADGRASNCRHHYVAAVFAHHHERLCRAHWMRQSPACSAPISSISWPGDWHVQPCFLQALAERVQQALAHIPQDVRAAMCRCCFTAHSMPKRVIEKEPDYIDHLKETAARVADWSGCLPIAGMFCYQSAGHTPEEWLKPDFADIMPELRRAGQTHVLIAPVQFLADHLEILYDIEIGAREQAEEHGIAFARIESLNTSPLFIKALASVVSEML